ncbi:hypothetical protein ACIPPQ_19175 [Sphingopyxis sp. LARHCG72]
MAVAYWYTRPASPDPDMARKILQHCLDQSGEGCLIEDDTKISELRALSFTLAATHDSSETIVASYEFRSEDRRYCAYVEIGKREMGWHRATQFYRCARRSSVHLGLG